MLRMRKLWFGFGPVTLSRSLWGSVGRWGMGTGEKYSPWWGLGIGMWRKIRGWGQGARRYSPTPPCPIDILTWHVSSLKFFLKMLMMVTWVLTPLFLKRFPGVSTPTSSCLFSFPFSVIATSSSFMLYFFINLCYKDFYNFPHFFFHFIGNRFTGSNIVLFTSQMVFQPVNPSNNYFATIITFDFSCYPSTKIPCFHVTSLQLPGALFWTLGRATLELPPTGVHHLRREKQQRRNQ